MSQAVKDALAKTSGGVSAQMSAIIGNNMFKGTATVMGDPDLGKKISSSIDWTPYHLVLYTQFSGTHFFAEWLGSDASGLDQSNFDAFDKKWLVTRITHKIQAGSYTTDIDMITYPNI